MKNAKHLLTEHGIITCKASKQKCLSHSINADSVITINKVCYFNVKRKIRVNACTSFTSEKIVQKNQPIFGMFIPTS